MAVDERKSEQKRGGKNNEKASIILSCVTSLYRQKYLRSSRELHVILFSTTEANSRKDVIAGAVIGERVMSSAGFRSPIKLMTEESVDEIGLIEGGSFGWTTDGPMFRPRKENIETNNNNNRQKHSYPIKGLTRV
jgi:hypothetical protein